MVNRKLIFYFSLIGLFMGILTVKGITQKWEPLIWLFFAVAVSLALSKKVCHKLLLHGFIIGLAWGMLNGLIQTICFETYLTNNPQFRESFEQVTFVPPRYFGLITGPVTGSIIGLILGGLSLLFKKYVYPLFRK